MLQALSGPTPSRPYRSEVESEAQEERIVPGVVVVLVTTSSLQAPLNKLRSFIWLSLEIESSPKIFASKKYARHTETWSYDRASLSSAVRIFRLKPYIYTLCFPESEAMRSSQMAFSKCASGSLD